MKKMQAFKLEFDRFSLNLGSKTCIMGILNTTPDSFFDKGKFNTHEKAIRQGIKLFKQGAQILDIGGESSRPFAKPVAQQEELDRVIPVIEKLAQKINIPISIDTTKAIVAKEALNAGASIINDISALRKDPDMVKVAAKNKTPIIMMHMQGTPETMQINPDYDDLLDEIISFFKSRINFAINNGIDKNNIILDPGIGFGKRIEHNLKIIKHIEKIALLGFPILVGPSRKSFIQKTLSKKYKKKLTSSNTLIKYGTFASVAALIMNKAHIIRVHDVLELVAFAHIIDSIKNV